MLLFGEEFVKLTGDYIKALILDYILCCSQQAKDAAGFIDEERRVLAGQSPERSAGWICKKAEELSEESMLYIGTKTMRKHLKCLVKKGWLAERNSPQGGLNRTLQYRVNLAKIQLDLAEVGYPCNLFEDNTRDNQSDLWDIEDA